MTYLLYFYFLGHLYKNKHLKNIFEIKLKFTRFRKKNIKYHLQNYKIVYEINNLIDELIFKKLKIKVWQLQPRYFEWGPVELVLNKAAHQILSQK